MSAGRVLFIGTVWPETDASAAGARTQSLVRAFREAGWETHFASGARDGEHRARLEREGVATHSARANDPAFRARVAELAPDVVVFDRFLTEEQFSWAVREAAPGCLRVLDTVDLHFLRRARQRALEAGHGIAEIASGALALESLAGEDLLREMAALYRSDLTLLISEAELELVCGRYSFPRERALLIPLLYDSPAARGAPGFAERSGFATIGNFRHPPNADAVLWLHREIWPRIRARATAGGLAPPELRVHGAYPPREMMALDDPATGFRVLGPARDAVESLAAARVALAPLRFGAGIKGKISDSWFAGTPVVTTGIGAEGMSYGLPWGGAVADDAETIATRALELLGDEAAWSEASARGRRILGERYDYARGAAGLLRSVEGARGRLEELRRRNVAGAVLWHQSHRSTEYFARWIELKERR